MLHFSSTREKYLWYWAFAVMTAIFATLFLGRPLAILNISQNVAAVVFVIVMVLIATAIITHAVKTKPQKRELAVIIGIAAVYIMFFLRLGVPERSHLMEYSVLAIIIHMALLERISKGQKVWQPALFAFLATFMMGVIDECLQLVIPDRLFDPNDIAFNGIVAFLAIGARGALQWVRKKKNSNHSK